jgi:prepilin-type N-terminal cleavage/methylation domain-containing protein
MSPAMRLGFTLIELLVVLAIMAVVFGMGITMTGLDRGAAQVQAAAEELAATLRQARTLAMTRNALHGVAFHIQNAPGSSGAVLNNRSGGHYYRIIGPKGPQDEAAGGSGNMELATSMGIPGTLPQVKLGMYEAKWQQYLGGIAAAWIGEPRPLPKARVRFLALSDTDEGPILGRRQGNGTIETWYGSGGETSYPRPYFGVFDPNTKTWYGWGSYASIGTAGNALKARGLWYDNGTPITGSQTAAGTPVPLVSADALDACIVFLPSGQAHYLEFKQGRRSYNDVATGPPWFKPTNQGGAMAMSGNIGFGVSAPVPFTVPGESYKYDIPEIAHFVRHNGGYHITLAADATSDETTFADARAALRAIGPIQRIFVGVNGTIRTQHVQIRDGYRPATAWWPPSAQDWLDTTASTANIVFRNCRFGWLHQPSTDFDGLKPRGRPVNYIVSSEMLVNRTWWCE